jgi:predicted nucleic acid-binding protein
MRWCFEGTSPYADRILDGLLSGDQAYVPMLWLYEVVSVLAQSERIGAISAEKAGGFMEDLRALEIDVDSGNREQIFGKVYQLALEYRLTGYDAAYLELAIRKGLPLASLDGDLNKAARRAGVEIIQH